MKNLKLTINEEAGTKSSNGITVLVHRLFLNGVVIAIHIADSYSKQNKEKVALVCEFPKYKDGVTLIEGEFYTVVKWAVSEDRLKKTYQYKRAVAEGLFHQIVKK